MTITEIEQEIAKIATVGREDNHVIGPTLQLSPPLSPGPNNPAKRSRLICDPSQSHF
jgi:hypothetical protein